MVSGVRFPGEKQKNKIDADVAELADALDLGSSASRRGGSSPSTRTILCGSGSVVEHRLAKARVAGSNPVFRSIYIIRMILAA